MIRPDLGRRALAEGLAAFALVFAGCGAIVADATRDGALGTLGVGLVFVTRRRSHRGGVKGRRLEVHEVIGRDHALLVGRAHDALG